MERKPYISLDDLFDRQICKQKRAIRITLNNIALRKLLRGELVTYVVDGYEIQIVAPDDVRKVVTGV